LSGILFCITSVLLCSGLFCYVILCQFYVKNDDLVHTLIVTSVICHWLVFQPLKLMFMDFLVDRISHFSQVGKEFSVSCGKTCVQRVSVILPGGCGGTGGRGGFGGSGGL